MNKLKKAFTSKKSLLSLAALIILIAVVLWLTLFNKGIGQNEETAPVSNATESPASETTPSSQPEKENTSIYYGTLEAMNKSEIIPEARGQILESPYSVGDEVSQGDLLIRMDDGGLEDAIALTLNSMAKNDLSISTNNENLANLKVYSPSDGILQSFSIKEGERINASKLGDIVNQDILIARVPFNANQIKDIAIGNSASLVSDRYMSSINGKVVAVYDEKIVSADGSVLYMVEIQTSESDAFGEGTEVSAQIQTANGMLISPDIGKMSYDEPVSLMSKGSGTAKKVYVKSGQKIMKDQLILEIENSTLEKTAQRTKLDREDLNIRLKSQKEDLEKCTVYSPITGVVIAKDHDVLDSITSTSESIMTVADISSLLFTTKVSQHDLSKISEGMPIVLLAENDVRINGTITKTDPSGNVFITIKNEGQIVPGTKASLDLSAQ